MIAFLVTGTSRARWFHRLGTSFECITWNALNQLTSVTKNAATVATYQYDPLGRRLEKVAGSTTTSWAYDGDSILSQNATTSAVTTTTRFTHGAGIDEPLAQENGDSGVVVYLHADGLTSVVRQTTSSGVVSETIGYDAWGNIQAGVPAPYAFTGREWDPSVALYYYRARFYDAATGRFIREDDIQRQGVFNQYGYGDDDPVSATDPLGLLAITKNCKGRTRQVQAAAAKAEAASQSCVPCNAKDKDTLKNGARTTVFECVSWTKSPTFKVPVCAENNFAGTVSITPAGFTDPRCGCLQGTILHELLHDIKGPAHDAGDRFKDELKCFRCAR